MIGWRYVLPVAVALVYVPTLADMAPIWWNDTYSGQGLFVPLFAALMLWTTRSELRATAGPVQRGGVVVVAGAVALLLAGRVTGSLVLQGLSLSVAAAGLVATGWGGRCLKQAAFPIAYLVFMIPPPHAALAAVTTTLQLFAANFAATSLQLIDVPVYRSGVMIELPGARLEVAEICNGLRFLFALVVMTAAFAYITQRGAVRQAVLIVTAVPVAIAANATRVAVLALGTYYVGPSVLEGTVHHLIGKAVWALTLISLIAVGFVLSRFGGSRNRPAKPLEVPSERRQPA